MNVTNLLTATIAIVDTFDQLTPTPIDDEVLEFLKVVRDSPLLVAWLEKKLAKVPTTGETGPSDPFRASLRAGRRDGNDNQGEPDRAEIGERLAGLGELMKYLPMILEVIKILRDSGILKKAA